jgi:branched-chain amino acid transport system substrate-binding protein
VTKKRLLVLSLVLLVLGLMSVVALAGCGSSSDDTATTAAQTATTAAPGGDTATTVAGSTDTTAAAAGTFDGSITVGALASMTGANAMTGAEMKWAYEQAAKDINAAGGVDVAGKKMELKLKFVDDKTDNTEGAAAVEKLIKVEGLKLILGTNITPINLAAGIVAQKYSAYYQISTSWTDYIEAQKFKWVSDVFFTPATAVEVPFNVVDLQPQADRPQNWCMLTEDNTDGQGLADGAVATAKAHGYPAPMVEKYTPGTKDFSSIILKLKQKNIDALILLISPADGITFVKQMKEQEYSPKVIFGWKGFWPSEFQQGLGADSNYMGHDGFWSEDNGQPGSKALGEAYKAAHDGLDSVSIGLSYASVQIMAQAITAAGSTDPAAVRDAVFGHTFKATTVGDVTYSATGIANVPCYGLWWKDGKRIQYWPDAGNKWEWFVPWNQR